MGRQAEWYLKAGTGSQCWRIYRLAGPGQQKSRVGGNGIERRKMQIHPDCLRSISTVPFPSYWRWQSQPEHLLSELVVVSVSCHVGPGLILGSTSCCTPTCPLPRGGSAGSPLRSCLVCHSWPRHSVDTFLQSLDKSYVYPIA